MRLSITMVLLIGAMVVTEVIGDPHMKKEVVKLRVWFEKTVKRLERGQTVTQHKDFIEFAIGHTDDLLRLLEYQTAINGEAIYLEAHYLEIDGKLVNRIQAVQNERVPGGPEKAYAINVLEAIKQVLRGNLRLARTAIEESKTVLPDDICPRTERLRSKILITNYEVVSRRDIGFPPQSDQTEVEPSQSSSTLPTGFSEPTRDQIATIRNWMVFRLNNVFPYNKQWVGWMMRWVPEIAYAVINSLPSQYVPSEESRFIGRVPVEEWSVIAGRIYRIETHITEMDQRRIDPIALIVKDVLRAMRGILRWDWSKAKTVMDNSRRQRPYRVSVDDTYKFYSYMDTTYRV
jgi:hypothetical protein